jgi:nucleotide-binding universal stress UspA family protein
VEFRHSVHGYSNELLKRAMFKKILLAYDGSPEYRSGLREGAELAQFVGAEVHLLAILAPTNNISLGDGIDPSALFAQGKKEAQAVLEEGVERLHKRGIKAQGRIGYHDPVDEIAATAREIGADLIVVGHRRRSSFQSWWNKSMSKTLLSVAPCSVLVSHLPPERE